ncbi:hydrogenase formation protein HypD [Candidatus Parabeggiatoa sp. HSG14]|uniref:hydrogenase formation protein HypD n=1 Tax=Candidatus Parabeggiatoa sp. HSG14 TaxID=3055593 RepID=UPI0025A6D178|nr:hydrogenase formation protein HypD [Thiotrichales bacterium HSG14]
MPLNAKTWLKEINSLTLPDKVKIMNVCGGHERSITQAGLRSVLPKSVHLIPGPGCPVCVCPEEDIYEAIQLALKESVTLVAFGDMLRVPVNLPRHEIRSLEQARSASADIRPIASPTEAVLIAKNNKEKPVVFFAAGFETTILPVASMLAEGVPDNLFVLMSGRLTWPAVAMLLESGEPGFDALVAPGHVSTVMGPEEWTFVAEKHHIPTAVAGFSSTSLLAAFYSTLRQLIEKKYFLDNCYPEVVHKGGNPTGKQYLENVLKVVDANWRGVGIIPNSGFALKEKYASHDARVRFPSYADNSRQRIGEMPAGCDCAKVVLGKIYPNECKLFGKTCTPREPIGPCMVSDEGACRIWWANRQRH